MEDETRDTSSGSVPVFNDVVARSTRFYTVVPAADVLHKIADIIAEDEHPLPAPQHLVLQKVVA